MDKFAVMFKKDKDIRRDFVHLRIWFGVMFLGLATLWFVFVGWVLWRMGPGGYSALDAQMDRDALCEILDKDFKHGNWVCPPIKEAQ